MAASQIGLYLTPINQHLVGDEVAYILGDCGARAFVVGKQFAEAGAAAADAAGIAPDRRFAVDTIPGFRPYAELTAGQPDTPPADRTAGSPMVYTSGTTGRPKGVAPTLPGSDTRGGGGAALDDRHPDRRAGRRGRASPAGAAVPLGAARVLDDRAAHRQHRRSDGEVVGRGHAAVHGALRRHEHADGADDVPPVARAPRPGARPRRRRHDPLGAPLGGAVPDRGQAPHDRVVGADPLRVLRRDRGWRSMVDSHQWLEKPGTVGKPWPGTDDHDPRRRRQRVPEREPGTIYLQTPFGAPEYHNDPEKTASVRHGDAFTLGDVGYLDADGWLFLCDRKIDMIISGGVNIYPAEIEAALLEHPKVGDAAVIGVPNEEWGEEVKAIVEPASRDGADARARRRAHGLLPHQAREVQGPAQHRLPTTAAALHVGEAVQAPATRRVLEGCRSHDLTRIPTGSPAPETRRNNGSSWLRDRGDSRPAPDLGLAWTRHAASGEERAAEVDAQRPRRAVQDVEHGRPGDVPVEHVLLGEPDRAHHLETVLRREAPGTPGEALRRPRRRALRRRRLPSSRRRRPRPTAPPPARRRAGASPTGRRRSAGRTAHACRRTPLPSTASSSPGRSAHTEIAPPAGSLDRGRRRRAARRERRGRCGAMHTNQAQ